QRFPRLNSRFDVKHIRDDFHRTGIKDPLVYEIAHKRKRLIVTFNGDDFKKFIGQRSKTGVINVSANLRNDQIDSKVTALLTKNRPGALFGKFTDVTGETES